MARKALGKTLWELIAEAAAGPQNALVARPKLGRPEDDAKHIRGYFRSPGEAPVIHGPSRVRIRVSKRPPNPRKNTD